MDDLFLEGFRSIGISVDTDKVGAHRGIFSCRQISDAGCRARDNHPLAVTRLNAHLRIGFVVPDHRENIGPLVFPKIFGESFIFHMGP
jgi:hypothetical protein